MLEIGVDEAGRGPVIGPLVVSAVAIPTQDVSMLVDKGVKDSKDLTANQREEIRTWFLDKCAERGWKFATILCPPNRVDHAVYDKGLNVLETELFAESINQLELIDYINIKIICDACDVDEQRFSRRISQLINAWPWEKSTIDSFHKADENYPIVGMASILAKQARDQSIKDIEDAVGFPIGSGYPSDAKTIAAVKKMISDKPHNELRWSWATVKRIWHQEKQTEMPSRLVSNGNQTTLF